LIFLETFYVEVVVAYGEMPEGECSCSGLDAESRVSSVMPMMPVDEMEEESEPF